VSLQYQKGKHANIVQSTLRIGVAQLLFLNTPPHAATSDTVQVLRMHHSLLSKKSFPVPEPMIRFVNGVLRKLSRPENSGTLLYGHKLLENTSVNDNIAPWLLQRWTEDWGETRTKLICQEMMPDVDGISSRIDVTTKYSMKSVIEGADEDVQHSPKALLEEIRLEFGHDCTLLPNGSLRIGSSLTGDISQWPDYKNGTWWVQDASSTLPALVLTQALSKKHGNLNSLHVIDMCSAPGGKACQLLSAGFGRVTAIEASRRRSKRLIENLDRLNFLCDKCEVIVDRGQNYLPEENACIDGILVDVPCSATGTGARQPDVLRRSSTSLNELLAIQELLAHHCANNILRPGGIMVYATCSMLKAESEEQVAKLLLDNVNMKTLPIEPSEVPGFEGAIDENGWLRVLPGVLEGDLKATDGFFVARLIKDEVS
jgi:16S rRNA (cytosine967-C5)-methyltransferase